MALTVRIIPCLDVRGGRVVKGINFKNIIDAGDPADVAKRYDAEGADEICMLDIDASYQERSTTLTTVEAIANQVFIPFTVGGGIKKLQDIEVLLKSGADKVSINTSAILEPNLIQEASKEFGSQCIVVAIDAKKDGDAWSVYTHGGKNKTELDAIEWAKKVEGLGAGEILMTSMDKDGMMNGPNFEETKKLAEVSKFPIIASGGISKIEDLEKLSQYENIHGAICGKALYENSLNLKEILERFDK